MTTLTQEPLTSVLREMFARADAPPSAEYRAAVAAMAPEERRAMSLDPDRYQEFYGLARSVYMAVSRDTAQLLYMLARASAARAVVEYGTSFGVSTLHLAAALRDNGGGGRVITTEFEPAKVAGARTHFERGGLADLIEVREGDATLTLATDLPDIVDLVLLDGAKHLYPEILDLIEDHLRPGSIIVADDVDRSPAYAARVRDSPRYMSLPFGDDVEVSVRVA